MSRRQEPALAKKLHLVHEAHANAILQARCLHQKAHLGDLDFLAAALQELELAAQTARLEAARLAGQERKEAEL